VGGVGFSIVRRRDDRVDQDPCLNDRGGRSNGGHTTTLYLERISVLQPPTILSKKAKGIEVVESFSIILTQV
jgi:hypothetical protein